MAIGNYVDKTVYHLANVDLVQSPRSHAKFLVLYERYETRPEHSLL